MMIMAAIMGSPQILPAAPNANDPAAVELLRAIEQRHGATQNVAGRFTQTKRMVDSPGDIKSAATFSLMKPNKFRADYTKPGEAEVSSTNMVVGRDAWQYVRDLKQVSHYRFSSDRNVRDLNYLLLGFGAHTEELLQVYRIKSMSKIPKGYRGVELIPLNTADAGFKAITILVTDTEALLPAQFSMLQSDNSQVTVDLDVRNLQIGARINDRIFRPDFPKDAELVELN